MSTGAWAAVTAIAAVLLIVGAVLARRAWRAFRRHLRTKVAHEQVVGHRGVRRRVQHAVGRRRDEFHDVLPAETMRGWVWFYVTRRPREGYRERTGWAPTKRIARWQLGRAIARDAELRGRARR